MDCPLQDSVLRIHYKGYLPDNGGLLFYDSRKDHGGEPVTFGSDEGLVRYSCKHSCTFGYIWGVST